MSNTYDFIKKQFENKGYKLLSKKYKNNQIKLKVKCPKGHLYKVTYNKFQQGKRCPICYNIIRSNEKRPSLNERKEIFTKYNHTLLTRKYTNNYTKLLVKCSKGHKYKTTYHSFQQGRRCPICWELEKHSRSEKDCLDVIKQIIPNEIIIENDRSQIINHITNQFLELDIYIPTLNKAIEFNGEYWHSFDDQKYRDKQKQIQCKEKSIDLLTIWYQDWVDDREKQIQKLKGFINVR